MREQPLNLRESLAVLCRRWVAVTVIAGLGALAGLALAEHHVPEARAAAEVLLPGPTAAGADTTGSDTQTQEIIVTSSSVLTPAAAAVSPPIPPDQLKHAIVASGPAANVLRIEAHAASSERAIQLVGAVTKEYQRYVETNKAVSGSTSIIQPPAAIPGKSKTRLLVLYGLLGLVGGVAVGSAIILVRAGSDGRLRRRDQIAGSIGAPILASLEADPYKNIADWRHLLEHFDSSAANAWKLRQVLRNLLPNDFDARFTVYVVSFVGDRAALSSGPQLALFAAESGIPTRLALGDDPALESLSAACAALRASDHVNFMLTLGPENETVDGELRPANRWSNEPPSGEAQLLVSVLAVDPSHPDLSVAGGPTILSVSSGFAVADDLARVALASASGGPGIQGIIVVNPDRSDATVGSLPEFMSAGWQVPGTNQGRASVPTTHVRSATNATGRVRWRA